MDKPTKIQLALNAAIIAAIFSVLISVVMLVNYWQLAYNDPIESVALKALVERLNDDPNNTELLHEIRMFDLMARKAYFTSKWQIGTGAILLLLGAVVLIISLRYYFSATSRIGEPEPNGVSTQSARVISSKWILGFGLLFIGFALFASFLSVDQLNKYQPGRSIIAGEPASQPDETIEVVDLTATESIDSLPISSEAKTATETSQEPSPNDSTSTLQEPVSTVKSPTLAEIKKQSNSFRGPLGNGVSFSKNSPTSWDVIAGTNVKWKVKTPKKGFSSPVIWGNKLFVTGADNAERWLYCYDRNNGKLLWQHQASNIAGSPATAPKTTDDTGLAAPSVTTDGNHVVAIFGTGDIVACDYSGNRVWAKNIGVPANHYGHSSSLIYWKGKVIVQYDTSRGSKLFALDIATGDQVWETTRTSRISWASPILAEIGGKMQVIAAAEPTVAGYDAETGKELWKNDCLSGEVGPSPAFGNGLVFATNEYATLAAINPENGSKVWETNEYLPEVSSPVVSDGLLFIATTYGVFACYDVHTGNKYWEKELGEGFYGSPVVADGKLYAAAMNGVIHILKVSREAELIASIPMNERVMTTPSFSDGCIYIRGVENLFCIGK